MKINEIRVIATIKEGKTLYTRNVSNEQ